jgi:hypothetical protein
MRLITPTLFNTHELIKYSTPENKALKFIHVQYIYFNTLFTHRHFKSDFLVLHSCSLRSCVPQGDSASPDGSGGDGVAAAATGRDLAQSAIHSATADGAAVPGAAMQVVWVVVGVAVATTGSPPWPAVDATAVTEWWPRQQDKILPNLRSTPPPPMALPSPEERCRWCGWWSEWWRRRQRAPLVGPLWTRRQRFRSPLRIEVGCKVLRGRLKSGPISGVC